MRKIKLHKGKKYSICSCGLSKAIPFCDNEMYIRGIFTSGVASLGIFIYELAPATNMKITIPKITLE